MPEETHSPSEIKPGGSDKAQKGKAKKKGRFFNRIPKDFLISPPGVVLVVIAIVFEIVDLFIPGGSLTLEIIPDVIFAVLLSIFAKVPLTSSIIPFVIERIPVISDILPTWVIRMFM